VTDPTAGKALPRPVVSHLSLDTDPPSILATACTSCGALFIERRNACARCSGHDLETRALAGTGRIRSYTVVHRAPPPVPTPFASIIVDHDGGGTTKANLLGDNAVATVRVGQQVRMTTFVAGTHPDGGDLVAFGFEAI
jgi:uncharacterized OB-fold protein